MESSIANPTLWELERKNICTHVTALKALDNFLLVAESNHILLYDYEKKTLLEKATVFQSSSIHGIRIDDTNNVLFFGAKSIRIYKFSYCQQKRFIGVSDEFTSDDWIHDIQWISEGKNTLNRFVAISAHNCLAFWEIEKGETNRYQCSENCILYSAHLIHHDVNLLVVAAGTVFNKILLWSPNSPNEINGRSIPFQSLSGHQGVIFSISYNKFHKLISSTSDDRSVRLWKIQSGDNHTQDTIEFWEKSIIQCLHVLFAHESRVWMSAVMDNFILSVGEDSHFCFWSLTGNLLKKKKCHKGGSVWCLEIASVLCHSGNNADKKHIAFTGGSDGGVYMWDIAAISSMALISQVSFQSFKSIEDSDFPRIILLLPNHLTNHFITTTDKGLLMLYNINQQHWQNIFYDNSFASYCVPSISNENVHLALGNMYGDLVLLTLSEQQFEKDDSKKYKIHEGKICSIHWVNQTNDYLLTCGLRGHMIFWKINYKNKTFDLQNIRELYLPKCKPHWWSTAALYVANSDAIVVGDRGGTISLYSDIHGKSTQLANPIIVHRYIHGENGVTDIQKHKSLIYSAGRDGKVQLYEIYDGQLNLIHSIKVSHDLEWIGRMLFYDEDLLLLGFHTKDFMVWSTKLESAVMTVECGGGHRSWDFCLSENGVATFAAIKRKDIIFCQEDLQHVLKNSILKDGISGQEFCHATYLYTKNYNSEGSMSIVACGGEDNALRIIGFLEFGQKSQILPLCSLSGHLSSIRSINKAKIPTENAYLLVSVGGRSQMMIWKLKDDSNVHCEQLASYILSDLDKKTKCSKKEADIQMNPQTRLMDVAVSFPETCVRTSQCMISLACSDSYLRVYLFDIKLKELSLCYNMHHGENCILKISEILLQNSFRSIFFASGSTDGCIKIFNGESYKMNPSEDCQISFETIIPHMQLKLHQSGINDLDAKPVTETTWLICSTGDDNALSAILVNFIINSISNAKIEVISQCRIPCAHASQITGVKIFDPRSVLTVSVDQRVNIWSWNYVGNTLTVELIASTMSSIPDIAHLEVWQNEASKVWNLLVCGQGIENFKLSRTSKDSQNNGTVL